MSAWIPITIAAAFVQNLRFMLQKHVRAVSLSTAGATFARFVFSFPLAIGLVAIYAALSGQGIPIPDGRFWAFALTGGVAQILATACVVALFAFRNFTVGMTFKNTETLQTALVGFLILNEGLSIPGLAAIVIGFIGVGFLADPPDQAVAGGLRARFMNRAAILGILAGAFFAVSATGYRGASLSLPTGDVLLRAAFTLAAVTTTQTLIMIVWLMLREPGEIGKVLRAWRVTALVGLTSMLGSLGWFTAFTLVSAAYVRVVGQVELVFSYAASVFVFKEKISLRELMGIALILLSVVVLVLDFGGIGPFARTSAG